MTAVLTISPASRAASIVANADAQMLLHYVRQGRKCWPTPISHCNSIWRQSVRQSLREWCESVSEAVATLREIRKQRGW